MARIKIACTERTLWDGVKRQLPDMPSPCGGRGSCGACRVRLISGSTQISDADTEHLSKKEIADGVRIACQSVPLSDCEIEVTVAGEEQIQALAAERDETFIKGDSFSIAIDIGTTTLAIALLDEKGRVIATQTGLNHQRSFGADVVSRIELAMKGQAAELTSCIRHDIRMGLYQLLSQNKLALKAVRHIVIAGNTTMEQLFFGLSVKELGSYPFLPLIKRSIHVEYGQLFSEKLSEEIELFERGAEKLTVTGFPCIAGFVGGDITAGLYKLLLESEREASVFLDIGTNGELAFIGSDVIVVASTAAGPVFEGGSICCGMASLPGAICATRTEGDMLICNTVKDMPPLGICGSGLIEAVADLRKLRVICKEGLMHQAWRERGYVLARGESGEIILLTQGDVREFQMAKAAIAAGVEILLDTVGLRQQQGKEYLLAGGFGANMSVKKAVCVGLLPMGTERRTIMAGNTSLKGVIQFLKKEAKDGTDSGAMEEVEGLLAKIEHIHLANRENFQEIFIKHMEL